jgi:hypothetical protein
MRVSTAVAMAAVVVVVLELVEVEFDVVVVVVLLTVGVTIVGEVNVLVEAANGSYTVLRIFSCFFGSATPCASPPPRPSIFSRLFFSGPPPC